MDLCFKINGMEKKVSDSQLDDTQGREWTLRHNFKTKWKSQVNEPSPTERWKVNIESTQVTTQVQVHLNSSLKDPQNKSKQTNHQINDPIKREILASTCKKKVVKEGTTGMEHV